MTKQIRRQRVTSLQRPTTTLRARFVSMGQWPAAPWLLLAVITAFAYSNACHETLILDDREFLAQGRFEQLPPAGFLDLFSQSLWEASGTHSNLYRPLLLVTLGIEAALFGDWVVGYHLFNILLHILATLLVFGFVRQVLLQLDYDPRASSVSAFLGALAFGVHPALTEVVNQAFNGSEIYATIAIAGGLWFLLTHSEEHPVRAWGLLGIVYFLALLYRESAVSLPALAVLTLWMTRRAPWTLRLRSCLPALILLIPLALYLALRANALDLPEADGQRMETASGRITDQARLTRYEPPLSLFAAPEDAPLREAPGSLLESLGGNLELSRVTLAVSTWFDALKLMVWPHPLVVMREVSVTPFWLALATQLSLFAFAIFRLVRGSPAPLFGLSFFYVAILPSSRIISDGFLPPILLDRMLYLPAIGLVICLSAAYLWLGKVISARFSVLVAALVVLIFLPVTWTRNDSWANELELLEHDFEYEKRNGQLLSSLITAQSRDGQSAYAIRLCEQNPKLVHETLLLSHNCAMVYASAGLHQKAEEMFLHALHLDPGSAWDHFELARLYVRIERRDQAIAHFEAAIRNESMAFLRELMQAMMLLDLHPDDPGRVREAKAHLERALQLQPRSVHARQLLDRLNQNPRA